MYLKKIYIYILLNVHTVIIVINFYRGKVMAMNGTLFLVSNIRTKQDHFVTDLSVTV